MKNDDINLLATKYYDSDVRKAEVLEEMIEECNCGEFKLTDEKFTEILQKHDLTEEEAMDWMVRLSKERGSFARVPYGWIFLEEKEVSEDYPGDLFFDKDGKLDLKFVKTLAD